MDVEVPKVHELCSMPHFLGVGGRDGRRKEERKESRKEGKKEGEGKNK